MKRGTGDWGKGKQVGRGCFCTYHKNDVFHSNATVGKNCCFKAVEACWGELWDAKEQEINMKPTEIKQGVYLLFLLQSCSLPIMPHIGRAEHIAKLAQQKCGLQSPGTSITKGREGWFEAER